MDLNLQDIKDATNNAKTIRAEEAAKKAEKRVIEKIKEASFIGRDCALINFSTIEGFNWLEKEDIRKIIDELIFKGFSVKVNGIVGNEGKVSEICVYWRD